jgi:predicted nucleic acid-binding protein
MSEAVLDAGPLIHLAELDALDVIHDFSTRYVAQAVWDEVTQYQPQALQKTGLGLQLISGIQPSDSLRALALGLSLGRGEVEALALMEKYPQALFLTDDAAARLAAEQRGCVVHGTVGLLIRSVRQGINRPQTVLTLLQKLPSNSTLYIRQHLLNSIIQRLQTEWQKEMKHE